MGLRRSGILWGLFALALVLAMWGWLWVVQRLLENEADATAARLVEAEERYLRVVAPIAEESIMNEVNSWIPAGHAERDTMIPLNLKRGVVSGAWFALDESDSVLDEETLAAWRRELRDGEVTVDQLEKALRTGELQWGWVKDGRDAVAGLVLSMLERDPGNEDLRRLLEERMWDYGGPSLRPAFRLLMIRKVLEWNATEFLRRLALAEELRMEWENTGAVEGYDVVRGEKNGESVVVFWTREQLENVVNRHSGAMELRNEEIPGVPGLRLTGPERWNVLGLVETSRGMFAAAEVNQSAMIWVGATSGLLVLALAVGAALLARKDYRLARMRTDLAASVAHELRTPLAGQRLLLESLMERSTMPETERTEYVEMSLRENLRLGRLAEEFLTFSRLERGVLALEEEPVSPKDAVREAVESLREKWDAPKCRLTVDVPDDLPAVTADKQALVTVLRNLLENAWKYSGKEKEIAVTAGEREGGVGIAVRDNGIGVAPADRERIFRQFYRVEQRLAREKDGLGIGLSIVRRLMGAMGGRIDLESKVGSGSEFKLWLPKVS
jgi:signal transduction histidine kinase